MRRQRRGCARRCGRERVGCRRRRAMTSLEATRRLCLARRPRQRVRSRSAPRSNCMSSTRVVAWVATAGTQEARALRRFQSDDKRTPADPAARYPDQLRAHAFERDRRHPPGFDDHAGRDCHSGRAHHRGHLAERSCRPARSDRCRLRGDDPSSVSRSTARRSSIAASGRATSLRRSASRLLLRACSIYLRIRPRTHWRWR